MKGTALRSLRTVSLKAKHARKMTKNLSNRASLRTKMRAFEKQEKCISKHMEQGPSGARRFPESRATTQRLSVNNGQYNYGMGVQHPNVYYVQSSFDRQTSHGQYRQPYCSITPGSISSVTGLNSRSQIVKKDVSHLSDSKSIKP